MALLWKAYHKKQHFVVSRGPKNLAQMPFSHPEMHPVYNGSNGVVVGEHGEQ